MEHRVVRDEPVGGHLGREVRSASIRFSGFGFGFSRRLAGVLADAALWRLIGSCQCHRPRPVAIEEGSSVEPVLGVSSRL